MGEGQPAMVRTTSQAFSPHRLYLPPGVQASPPAWEPTPWLLSPLLNPPRLPSALSFSEVSLTTLSLLGDRVSFQEGGTLLPEAESDLWF